MQDYDHFRKEMNEVSSAITPAPSQEEHFELWHKKEEPK